MRCNMQGNVMELIKELKNIDFNDIWQVLCLGIIILAFIIKYLRVLYASKCELLFMKQKDIHKRDVCAVMILFFALIFFNVVLSVSSYFITAEIIAVFLAIPIWGIGLIIAKIQKNDSTNLKLYFELFEITVMMPLGVGSGLMDGYINRVSLSIIVSVIEVALYILLLDGVTNGVEFSGLFIQKDDAKLYIYKKIDDGTLLCGDSKNMREASFVVPIDIQPIWNGDEILYIEKSELTEQKTKGVSSKNNH